MNMDELRDAFAAWAIGEPFQNAFEITQLLTDPTPITEEGLREMGLQQYFGSCVWWAGELRFTYEDDTLHFERREIKTLGKLRLLLLGVGE